MSITRRGFAYSFHRLADQPTEFRAHRAKGQPAVSLARGIKPKSGREKPLIKTLVAILFADWKLNGFRTASGLGLSLLALCWCQPGKCISPVDLVPPPLRNVEEISFDVSYEIQQGSYHSHIDGTPTLEWSFPSSGRAQMHAEMKKGKLQAASLDLSDVSPTVLSIAQGDIRDRQLKVSRITFEPDGSVSEIFDSNGQDVLPSLLWAEAFRKHLTLIQDFGDLVSGPPILSFSTSPSPFRGMALSGSHPTVRFANGSDLTIAERSPGCLNGFNSTAEFDGTLSAMSSDFSSSRTHIELTDVQLTNATGCLQVSEGKLQFIRTNVRISHLAYTVFNGALTTSLDVSAVAGSFSFESPTAATGPIDSSVHHLVLNGSGATVLIKGGIGGVLSFLQNGNKTHISGLLFSSVGALIVASTAPYSIVLNRATSIAGTNLPAGSTVDVSADGLPVRILLSTNQTIQGLPCLHDTVVRFFPDGTMAEATPAGDVTFKGLPLAGGQTVLMFEDGTVKSGTVSRDVVYLGHKFRGGTNFTLSESERRIRTGLKLVNLGQDTAQMLGWGAMSRGFRSGDLSEADAKSIVADSEAIALAADSDASLAALQSAYAFTDQIRLANISGVPASPSTDQLLRFRVAVMAEISGGKKSLPVPKLPAISGNHDAQNAIVRQIGSNGDDETGHYLIQLLSTKPTDIGLDDFLFLTLVAKSVAWRKTLPQPQTDSQLAALLLHGTTGKDSALTSRINQLGTKMALTMVVSGEPSFSMSSIANAAHLNPVNAPNGVPDRDLAISILPVTIHAEYKPYPLCPGCDDVYTQHSSATSSSLVSIRNLWVDNNNSNNTFPNYTCLSGSDYGVGSCFLKFTESRSYAGVPITAFGIHNRTWITGSFGPERPTYVIDVGYRPAPSTNWIAVRWNSNNNTSSQISGTSGFLFPQAIVTERSSGWSIYQVSPGSQVSLHATFVANAYTGADLHRLYTYGFQASPDNIDAIEVLELNDTNILAFNAVKPLEINKEVASDPLLAYVAGLQDSTLKNGWLSGADPNSTTAVLPLISYLQRLGAMPLQSPMVPDPTDPRYPQVDWQSRQKLAVAAGPSLAYRMFETDSAALEAGVSSSSALFERVSAIDQSLSSALETINALSMGQLKTLVLNYSQLVAHDRDSESVVAACQQAAGADVNLQLLCLQSEVEGAESATADVLDSTHQTFQVNCAVLKLYAFDGVSTELAIHPDKGIMDLCAQQ